MTGRITVRRSCRLLQAAEREHARTQPFAGLTLRAGRAVVSVVEPDPVLRLKANLAGYLVPWREHALRSADVVVTVTGAASVSTEADLPLLRDGAVLANGGHFPWEIAVQAMTADPAVASSSASAEG